MPEKDELQGLLNVKCPSKIRSRRFLPWKTWRKQWVVLRRSPGSPCGLELLIGRGSQSVVQISKDDVIYRTESRTHDFAFGVFPSTSSRRANFYLAGSSETESQQWISTIRNLQYPVLCPVEEGEFSISVVDNVFSRSAGLGGLHGTLRIFPDHVAVADPTTGHVRAHWPWSMLSQFHVASVSTQEDEGHICTILTTSKFPAGVGRIHIFSADAVALTARLLGKGRPSSLGACPQPRVTSPYRHHTFSFKFPERGSKPIKTTPSSPLLFPYGTLRKLSSGSRTFNMSRRLSRSEGNLRAVCEQLDRSGRTSPCSHDSGEKSSISSEDSVLRGRVANSLLHAGFGLMLSTPGCSECDSESAHEYQRVGDEEFEEDFGGLVFCSPHKYSPPRRESGVSVASGVYEEITDFSIHLDTSCLDPVAEDCEEPPPPLPPRRDLAVKCESPVENVYTTMLQIPRPHAYQSRSADNSPLPSPPHLSVHSATKSMEWQKTSEDSTYLPMSALHLSVPHTIKSKTQPRPSEESTYLPMSALHVCATTPTEALEDATYLPMSALQVSPCAKTPTERQKIMEDATYLPMSALHVSPCAKTPTERQKIMEDATYLPMSALHLSIPNATKKSAERQKTAEDATYLPMSALHLSIPHATKSAERQKTAEDVTYLPMSALHLSVPCATKSTEWQKTVEESHYLPMSPGRMMGDFLAKDPLDEPHYMVMASVKMT